MLKKMVSEQGMSIDEAMEQDMFDLVEIMNTDESDKFDNPMDVIDMYK